MLEIRKNYIIIKYESMNELNFRFKRHLMHKTNYHKYFCIKIHVSELTYQIIFRIHFQSQPLDDAVNIHKMIEFQSNEIFLNKFILNYDDS